MKNSKKDSAITLIVLVIKIVLLLILAGISIQAITHTGLFEKAKQAKQESKYANAAEKVALAVNASYDETGKMNDDYLKENVNKIEGLNKKVDTVTYDLKIVVDGFEFTISEYGKITGEKKEVAALPDNTKDTEAGTNVKVPDSWNSQNVKYIKTTDGTEVTTLEKVSTVYAVSDGKNNTIPIPKGFYYVGGTKDTGIIISDNEADKYEKGKDKTKHDYATQLKGNQFVWIPCSVDEYVKIDFGMKNSASWDMETNTAEKGQIEKYGGFYVGRYEAGVSTLDESTGTFKDSVKFSNNASLFSAVSIQTGINGWGWQNYDFIARGKLITDSNYPNKATGNIVEKANSIPYYHADYYTAVEMSNRLYSKNSFVKSGLVTGTQWDMMMKFLSDKSDYSDIKSTDWGNFDNVSLSNLRGYYTNVSASDASTNGFKKIGNDLKTDAGEKTWVILTTGSTAQVLKKGLYDVAGNLWEWTQEASYVKLDYNTTYNTYNLRGRFFHRCIREHPSLLPCIPFCSSYLYDLRLSSSTLYKVEQRYM